ncbi:glycine-zipper containing OmpA-like membrane domain-containing protein [Nitrosomonas sp. PY1]|uniref:hypothetical protein n=1 Tax=Nitrosomonas sp. PY1 TaxID=1803906 RepID=UPI001FC83BF2|nr:hypothetical protein [Nitrosomonas sp. PY1]GKS69592.1 glycine-zipper containing OmpA-like membrane domain-containing protein [Nitrosomonas sp. PY1]
MLKHKLIVICILSTIFLLSACVNMPSGPSVMTLPGSGKNFEQFRADEFSCRQYAIEQLGGKSVQSAYNTSGLQSVAVGSGLGAAAGAAMGGGEGAAIGAGAGLLMGGLMGSGSATTSGYEAQRRYDISYIQCMYAKGHRVPIDGRISNDAPSNNYQRSSAPAPGFTPPPPPSGNPPPPPPR